MVFLFAAAAGIVLLYFWLLGHWFARVLMFICLALLCGIMIPAMFAPHYHESVPIGLLWMGAGFVLAWFLAGIPVYASNSPKRIKRAVRRAVMRAEKANMLAVRRASGETGFWGQRI